jgi:hypothetical protein
LLGSSGGFASENAATRILSLFNRQSA